MESSNRIFVVLSAILFLEASAFDSYQTYQTHGSTNYPSNSQSLSYSKNFPTSASQSTGANLASSTYGNGPRINVNTGSNSGSTLFGGLNGGYGSKSGSTLFSGSNSHASAFSTGLNSGSTLYGSSDKGYRSTLNTDSKIGSNLYSSPNIGHESTFNTGSRIGSALYGGSNSGYKSTVNAESGYGSTHVGAFDSKLNDGSSFSTIHSLPLSTTTHTQPLLTTNSQSLHNYNSLSTNPSTNLNLSQNYLGGFANSGNDKFKIVHIPITTGSQISQTIKLPLTGNANYKVLHLNPTIANTNIPDNVLTDVKRAEYGVHKALDLSTLNGDKVSLGYHNYDSGKNLPSNVFHTIKQAESELSEMVDKNNNRKETSHNNNYYPGTNNFNNYHQTYSPTRSQTISSSNSMPQDAHNVYDINFGKNITPNELNDSLTQADVELKNVLNDYEKVKDNQPAVYQSITSSNSAASSIRAGNQNVYDFSGSNTLYNHNQRYDNSRVTPFSYSNAQASSSSGTVQPHYRNSNEYDSNTRKNLFSNNVLSALTLADVKLEKVLDTVEGEKSTTYTSTNNSSFTGGQYSHLPLYNNRHHYTSSTLKTPNQSYGYDRIASSALGNAQASASATASSTSLNGYNPYGNNNYPNLSFPKHVTTVADHSNTAANSENESKSHSTLNYVPNKYNNYPLLRNYNYTSLNWQKYPNQPASISSQTADLSANQYMIPNNPTNFGNMQYNTDSQQTVNRENYHKHSHGYGQNNNYRFNIPQSPTTMSPIDEYTVSTNNPPIYENLQTSSVESIESDKWKIPVNSESNAQVEAAAAQTITNIPHQTADSDRRYLFNGPTYEYGHQPHIIQSTDLPEEIVTNNPVSTGNEQSSGLLYSQNSFESNNPTDDIPYLLYNNGGMASTQSPYFPAYGQYYGDQTSTDFPVDEYAIPNNFDNYNSNLPLSPVDNSMPTQYPNDGANNENQDFIEYMNQDKVISTFDTTKSTADSSTANSQAQTMYYHKMPLNYHPRYHRLNWRKHELPPNAIKPQLTHYNDAKSDYPSLGDKQESTVSHSETNYKSDDDDYLSNDDDITQMSSAEYSNDGIRPMKDNENNHYVALPDYSQQSHAVANSQSANNVEVVNSDNVYHHNNAQLYNQPTLNQYTKDDNNQQILINYQNSNVDGYSSNNQANGDKSTTRTPIIVTTTDSGYYDENYDDSEFDQLVQTDKIVQVDSNGLQYMEDDKDQTTNSDSSSLSTVIQEQGDKDQTTNTDSSSSSTVIQEQDNLIDDQDKSLTSYNTKTSGFTKLSTSLNKNLATTPYARAFDALIKILDSLDKLFGNKNKQ